MSFYRMIVAPAILAVVFPVMLENIELYQKLKRELERAEKMENLWALYTNGVDW